MADDPVGALGQQTAELVFATAGFTAGAERGQGEPLLGSELCKPRDDITGLGMNDKDQDFAAACPLTLQQRQ